MAEKSAISWTRSTFNPWIGCTRVGPGCDHCYAAVSTPARAMKIQWGAGQPRHPTSIQNWNKVFRWNQLAPGSTFAGRKGFWPVFCASLADVFDNEAPEGWRENLFTLIGRTPNLSWLLVTKRIGNVERMVPGFWMKEGFPAHVRILITVVNEQEATRDIPKLLALPCKNGISYEPALGPVDFEGFFTSDYLPADRYGAPPERGIEWIIIGGESSQGGAEARPFDIEWARSTVRQCKEAGVPVFVKQLGSYPVSASVPVSSDGTYCFHMSSEHPPGRIALMLHDRAGADPSEWPEDLRVQEFPV